MFENIEGLLRMVADFHHFCSDDYKKAEEMDSGELSLEELDYITAAAGTPANYADVKNEENDQIK